MKIKPVIDSFKQPTRNSDGAGGYDLYMPTDGVAFRGSAEATTIDLGFQCELPEGHIGLIVPRSGAGAKRGASLNNTVAVIDQDYRGNWILKIRNRNEDPLMWNAGDSLFQVLVVPVYTGEAEIVDELSDTERGDGGFGSTDVDIDLEEQGSTVDKSSEI